MRAFQPQPGCSPNGSCATNQLPAARFAVKVAGNVPYVQPAGPQQVGDLYLPQGATATPFPAVVIVHGGSWDNGRNGTPGTTLLAQSLAQHGYVVFDINYRLVGQGGEYPNDIQDVLDAVAYLQTHAGQWNVDLHKLAVVGVTAGGYLALMAGYRANVPPFIAPHYPGVHVQIQAVGSFFAPVELKASVLNADGMTRVDKLAAYLGATFDQGHARYRMASPLRYSDTAVPTIMWYGAGDPMTPFHQTFELYKRLRQRQLNAQLEELPGEPDRLTQLSIKARNIVLKQLLTFLHNVLTSSPSST
jgi:acetyl esterase/lipase